jgi:hypothetical protein
VLNSKTPLLAYVLAALLGVGATLGLQTDESVRKLSAVKLPNVPGQTLTAEVVEYPPGENPVFTITPVTSSRTY